MAAYKPSLLLVLILGALTAFTPMSVDMYLPSFPALERYFSARASDVQLTLSTFFLGLAIGQAIYGPVSDRFGRRPPLIFGSIVYILASLGCALAPSIDGLIAFRFLQALGGCVGMVISRSIVRDLFDERGAAKMFATLMAIMGVAPILAPLLGGQLLIFMNWQAMFWILAGFGCLILILVHFWLPETLPPERRRSLHPGSVFRTYIRILSDRYFMGHSLSQSLTFAGMFAYITGSPFVLISLYGVPAEYYGFVFGLNAFGFIGAAQINVRLLSRTTPGVILALGLMAAAIAGSCVFLAALTGIGGLAGLLVPLFFFLTCLGFIGPNSTARALQPQGANAGAASAVLGMIQFTMGGLSGAIVAALPKTSALPMAVTIGGCAVLGLLVHRALVGER
ncbi:MAG: Bcr/CflA family multidrug efflux MFS transporter [Alphaproteobacteria bacterium]|nr:Bcr/CflA family multidrug efflux MFS transporter [Alphaproteobacteria bacterium]